MLRRAFRDLSEPNSPPTCAFLLPWLLLGIGAALRLCIPYSFRKFVQIIWTGLATNHSVHTLHRLHLPKPYVFPGLKWQEGEGEMERERGGGKGEGKGEGDGRGKGREGPTPRDRLHTPQQSHKQRIKGASELASPNTCATFTCGQIAASPTW